MNALRNALASALIVLLLSVSAPVLAASHDGTPVAGRDWKKYPAIASLPASQTIYALGDLHGDCDRQLQLLLAGKLIAAIPDKPENVQWTGGKADLVITGDMIDKYDQALRVIAVLRALEPQVQEAGGHLVVCLGNHEAEFLASGGAGSKNAEFDKELKSAGISAADVAAGRDSTGIGAWLRDLPAGAKVGDWFFCHAGNTHGKSVTELESELEHALSDQGYSTPLLLDPDSMLEARMHPRPWWEGTNDPSLHDLKEPKTTPRESSKEKKAESEKYAEEKDKIKKEEENPPKLIADLEALHVKHLVIGHQPGKATFADGTIRPEGQMFQHFQGKFFMIDTGMSRGVSGGRGALLKIEITSSEESATAVYADGKSVPLWRK